MTIVTVPFDLLSERLKQSPHEFVTEEIIGAVPSNVQVNCVAAAFGLSHASVNTPPAISTLVTPSADGVNVAV